MNDLFSNADPIFKLFQCLHSQGDMITIQTLVELGANPSIKSKVKEIIYRGQQIKLLATLHACFPLFVENFFSTPHCLYHGSYIPLSTDDGVDEDQFHSQDVLCAVDARFYLSNFGRFVSGGIHACGRGSQ